MIAIRPLRHFRMLLHGQALLREATSEMQMIEIIEERGIAKEMSIIGWRLEKDDHTVRGSDTSSLPKLRARLNRDLDVEV